MRQDGEHAPQPVGAVARHEVALDVALELADAQQAGLDGAAEHRGHGDEDEARQLGVLGLLAGHAHAPVAARPDSRLRASLGREAERARSGRLPAGEHSVEPTAIERPRL